MSESSSLWITTKWYVTTLTISSPGAGVGGEAAADKWLRSRGLAPARRGCYARERVFVGRGYVGRNSLPLLDHSDRSSPELGRQEQSW